MEYSSSQSPQYLFASIVTILFLLIKSSTPLEFNFCSLSKSNRSLITEGNTTFLDSNQLELTANKTDQIGRVRYSSQLHLWDDSSGEIEESDFTSTFSFIVYSTDRAPGDGVAFFLAQPPFLMPRVTDGSTIGLVSSEERRRSTHAFVAVEFDTFGNDLDSLEPNTHVGIDVNSLVSQKSVSWACDIQSPNVYNATVSYVAPSKNLTVVFDGYIGKRRIQQSLSYEIRLADYLPEWVDFGFSAANGLFTSRHILLSWSFRSTSSEIETGSNSAKASSDSGGKSLLLGLSIGGALVFISLMILIVLFVFWKKKTKRNKYWDDESEKETGKKEFSYDEIALASAGNFNDHAKLSR